MPYGFLHISLIGPNLTKTIPTKNSNGKLNYKTSSNPRKSNHELIIIFPPNSRKRFIKNNSICNLQKNVIKQPTENYSKTTRLLKVELEIFSELFL